MNCNNVIYYLPTSDREQETSNWEIVIQFNKTKFNFTILHFIIPFVQKKRRNM